MPRQAYGDGVRKRQENAASRDKEGQGIIPENPFRTKNQQMKAEPNSSETESSRRQGENHRWQQELGKEQRLPTEREEPKTEPSKTVRRREGNRMSPMAGIRSRTPPPQGAGSGTIETAREQFDVHIKEKTPEEKSASSLKEVAREAMKAASAGALSVIGAAWKAQKTASSWNKAQGALAKVPQVLRRRENRQTGEGPGQRERGVAIESHP